MWPQIRSIFVLGASFVVLVTFGAVAKEGIHGNPWAGIAALTFWLFVIRWGLKYGGR